MTRETQRQAEDVVIRALLPSDVELFRSVRMHALEDSPDAYVEKPMLRAQLVLLCRFCNPRLGDSSRSFHYDWAG